MITSAEIKNAKFGRATRGYKPVDVDIILERAAETIDRLNNENAEILRKMEVLAEKIQEYRKDEESIHAALLTAQRSADQLMREANENAQAVVTKAQNTSDEALSAAKNKAEEMLKEAQQKSVAVVNETREKATMYMEEAKAKSDNIVAEAQKKADQMTQEAVKKCKIELMQLEAVKKQAAEFRAALMDMYRQQFELMKKGPVIELSVEEELNEEFEQQEQEEDAVEEAQSVEEVSEQPQETEANAAANYVDPVDVPLPVAEKPQDDEQDDADISPILGGFQLNSEE